MTEQDAAGHDGEPRDSGGEHPAPISDAQVRDWVDVGVAAVLAAAPIALEHFRAGVAIDDKRGLGVYDPVTVADRDVEASIRAHLAAHLPSHGIAGEEHPDSEGDPRISWVIDPIDGTRAYVSGMPTWGSLLGLVVDGVAVGGVMHQAFTGETFVADPVRGARLLLRGEERTLRTRHVPDGVADAVLYSTHPFQLATVGATAAFESIAGEVRLQRWGGDCYMFAMLAAGQVDLIIEGSLKSYDIAALIPIITGAGGVVTTWDGKPAQSGGRIIAAGDPRVHEAAIKLLNS